MQTRRKERASWREDGLTCAYLHGAVRARLGVSVFPTAESRNFCRERGRCQGLSGAAVFSRLSESSWF